MDELNDVGELATLRTPWGDESADYSAAREALLATEIEMRRHLTRVAAQRQALPPGPLVTQDWRFKDEQGFDATLTDLFGEHDTLVTYFWMYGPQRERPCPMCTNWLGAMNGNARDIKQRVALKVFGRSPVSRQYAFAQERGWHDLDFVHTVGDDYARAFHALNEDETENPVLAVYQKDGDAIRLFYRAEMPMAAADPGQDPRTAPDIATLWNVLDLTPEGRGTDWYPRLSY